MSHGEKLLLQIEEKLGHWEPADFVGDQLLESGQVKKGILDSAAVDELENLRNVLLAHDVPLLEKHQHVELDQELWVGLEDPSQVGLHERDDLFNISPLEIGGKLLEEVFQRPLRGKRLHSRLLLEETRLLFHVVLHEVFHYQVV